MKKDGMHLWAILLAAGRGARLAGHCGGVRKQFLPHRGRPLFWHSALAFAKLAFLRGIVFVFPGTDALSFPVDETSVPAPSDAAAMLRRLDDGGPLGLPWRTAVGGARRQDSVANGLAVLPKECDAVLIHDSARPFASPALMARVAEGLAQGHAAVIPGIPVTDTIKYVDADGLVSRTLPREALRAVQTPQGFALAPLRQAHARAASEGWEVTDDASLLERCGLPVVMVDGEAANRKITSADDLVLLERTEENGMPDLIPCTGFGYDVHRYGGDRPFLLGGVPIPCDIRIAAHSDGDTLLHALMDALLGCIAEGDIGALFPDTDPAFAGVSSGILLAEVVERTRCAGLRICHVDITIVAQTPRIAPHRRAIAANLATLLQIPVEWVTVKATTEEGLGFTGEKKGIKVMAVVSGLKSDAVGRNTRGSRNGSCSA